MKAYVIELYSDHDATRDLRALLKIAWRRYHLRCDRIVEVGQQGVIEIDAYPVIESTVTPVTEDQR